MNIDNLLIEANEIEIAQDICKVINESATRSRAVANVLATNLASRFFEAEGIDSDVESGLHNVGKVLEDIDIADIYLKGSYVDVRLYFDNSELLIPKAHFDNNLLPVAYMFIKLSPDLSRVSLSGFVLPDAVDVKEEENGYYKIDENSFVSFYDIESSLAYVEDTYSVEEEQIFAYMDDEIENKAEFYSQLIASKDARIRLIKIAKAQYVLNFVSISEKAVTENQEEQLLSEQEDSEVFDLELADDNLLQEEDVPSLLDQEEFSPLNSEFEEFDDTDSMVLDIDTADEDLLNDAQEDLTQDGEEEDILGAETPTNYSEQSEANIEEDAVENLATKDETTSDVINEDENTSDGFDFQTVVSPSFNDEQDDSASVYAELLNGNDVVEDEANLEGSENQEVESNVNESLHDTEEQISALYDVHTDDMDGNMGFKQKRSSSPILLIALFIIIGAASYFGYTKFFAPSPIDETANNIETETNGSVENNSENVDAMPIETVETPTLDKVSNEGNSVSIPAIEQNLDASIIVSNLSVAWEVPSGYASNTSAGRYLTKLGKIIQLNLKTELLLLSKPPITNKISIEVKFDNATRKFETVGIVTSSGEKSVDDLILKTVNNVLNMNLNINTDSFSKLQGNPVLIIKL